MEYVIEIGVGAMIYITSSIDRFRHLKANGTDTQTGRGSHKSTFILTSIGL
jgi:hypothetical protein